VRVLEEDVTTAAIQEERTQWARVAVEVRHRSAGIRENCEEPRTMPQIDLTARELTILEFVLDDLAEAIDDGDRPEFNANEVDELLKKVLVVMGKPGRPEP
jgi:hypothetical protein